MDCEKFDRVALDLLYDELDELTAAAARRHTEHCSRCRAIGSRLRATRQLGVVPLTPPPPGLKARILEAERQASAGLGLKQRAGRTISILAGYAMRPQLPMVALFLLMIGASLIFLRARPGERDNVMVTERGVPESESDSVALIPVPEKLPEMEAPAAELKAAPVPQAAAAPAGAADKRDMGRGSSDDDTSAFAAAMEHYNQHRYLEAEQRFDAIAAAGGQESRDAARFAALAAHERGGCAASLQRFELLGNRYARTDLGAEATLRAAKCHADLGNTDQARQAYQSLLASPKYGSEAQAGLDVLDGQMVATRKARSAPASTAPAEAAKATKSAPSPNTVSPGDEAK